MTATVTEQVTDQGSKPAEPCWARKHGKWPCIKTAEFQILVTCVCEHMKWLPACEEHKDLAVDGRMGCRQCRYNSHLTVAEVLMVEAI